ncbi:TetR/AcrR family transcriptional regulator [Amycolatopsis rhabdoformis]|uniref:TetR/AcrR family transcriptional regulator n=1 Tax=Amycolatopsis rhabdoformis TaxID=1448059 RepID=A0ABZ1IL84_9PSEU|nr:TetR/AcrR family transcriptional regulator [Amycolatopsis rhabdoformis]WSE34993.1 TetR/AcrR family transcriptional regulator [Amycolatopsis rhabdoformis]
MASGPAERARLLALTRELILERGVIGLSLSEVARSIGSNNRMLLYHFGSLDALLAAAVDEIVGGTELLDRLAGLLNEPGRVVDRLGAAWAHLAEPARRPHLRVFFARFGMAVDQPERDAEFLRQVRERWTAVVADALREDVRNPDDTAVAVVALWRGLQVQLICGEDEDRLAAVHSAAVTGLCGSLEK